MTCECPVCGRTLTMTYETDGGQVSESHAVCPCGYVYDFLCGHHREWLGLCWLVDSDIDLRWRFLRWLWRVVTLDGCITVEVTP